MYYDHCAPAEWRAIAAALIPRVDGEDRHWTRIAEVVGRVDDTGSWSSFGFASTADWAAAELGMTRWQTAETVKLWELMKGLDRTVTAAQWATISRANARLVQKGLAAGLPAAELIPAAAGLYTPLKQLVERGLGQETWQRVSIRLPTSLVPVFEATMAHAARRALGDPTLDPERALDADVAFRALEVICADYAAGGGGPRP
jgi:hypothetical protein